jgi:hypothetical protein
MEVLKFPLFYFFSFLAETAKVVFTLYISHRIALAGMAKKVKN